MRFMEESRNDMTDLTIREVLPQDEILLVDILGDGHAVFWRSGIWMLYKSRNGVDVP